MTDRPHLTVVGGKALEPDDHSEMADLIAKVAGRMAEAVKTGGAFWVVTEVEGEISVAYYGGKLESSALAEEIAREKKCEALGFE